MTVTKKKTKKIATKKRKDATTNPYGSNQYMLDPRQITFWEMYTDPKSETWGNAYQTALSVGYEDNYAKTITVTEWFLDKVRSLNLLSKAEKVLEDALSIPHLMRGGRVNLDSLAVKISTAKFIASTKGKDQGYSTKSEVDLTSKGKRLPAGQVVIGMEIIKEPKEVEKENTIQDKK